MKTETQTIEERTDTLDLLKGNKWFKNNPSKILGEEYQTTDRFSKPVTKVRGTMDDVMQGIDIPQEYTPKEHAEALETTRKKPVEEIATDKIAKANIDKIIRQTKKQHVEKALGKKVGKSDNCPEEYYCFEDIMEQYNEGISEDEIKAWVWYKLKTNGINDEKVLFNPKNGWNKYLTILEDTAKYLEKWLKDGIICYTNGSYIPSVIYYAENIYQKQAQLLKDKEAIIESFGQEQYDRQWNSLENIKPNKLTLADPEVNNRLFIKPTSSFAKEHKVAELTDGQTFREYNFQAGRYETGAVSLQEAFKVWLKAIPKDEFKKSNDYNIIYYYLENKTPPRHYEKEEKLRIRQNAKIEGDQLFVQFMAEAITRDDQLKIEQVWNGKYNAYVPINYFKIPVGFTVSKTFKNKPLFIRPAQREGIGFINVHGSGCIAYDVGVGKTMTAILAIANAIEGGQCKRPFIVVPNQTYKNWIAELQGVVENGINISTGILPQYKVNDLYNLGASYIEQLTDDEGNIQPVPEYSISVLTYEGFNRLGFNEATWKDIGKELYSILNQGMEEKREQAKLFEKVEEMMGKGIKGGMINIEDLGFDFMTVDEAHAAKKSFTQVKGEVSAGGKRERSSYEIKSGQPSMIALRAFMISQYILRNYKMRNVLLLTATPFTNSPLEIYSMLALIGYQELKNWGINNLKEFFNTFIKTSMELVINAKMKPERKEIILGFNNLISLQQLIFKFINYKTGEDANIQRPNKIVLPLMSKKVGDHYEALPAEEQVSTNLPMTTTQRSFMKDVENYVRGKTSLMNLCVNPTGNIDEEAGEENKGEALDERKLSDDEQEGATVLRGLSFARQLALSPYLYACNPEKTPTYEEYIETSPKLKYVMGSIQSVKQWHEQRGEEVSGQVIYMNAGVQFFPFIKDYLVKKIGFQESEIGIIKGGMSTSKKEGIKDRFLSGKVKVIIGSASIKEGINLQNRSTVLYNCWLDWNPTDVKQLEGRIWRFGNKYANVRIVNPLMENSIDSFIFQKLEEKTSRINEIWYQSGKTNALSLEEFDPSELKTGLITDPHALAELLLMDEREKMRDGINSLQNQIQVLEDIKEARNTFNSNIDYIKNKVKQYKPVKEGTKARTTETIFKIFRNFLEDENTETSYSDENIYDKVRKANSVIKRGIEQILAPRGLDINFDYEKVVKDMKEDIERQQEIQQDRTGEKAVEQKAQEIIKERIAKKYKPKSVSERVLEFSSLNDELLSSFMAYELPGEKEEAEIIAIKGKDLEDSADIISEMEQLMVDMEEMASLMEEMEQLTKKAA